MNRLSIAALLLAAATFSSTAHAQDAQVVPFVKKGVDPLIVLNITSLVASELDFMGSYDDVEQLDDYPSGYSLACLSKTSCMGSVGKALGTDFLVGGSVASAGSQFDVYMVLFDVNRGTFVRKKTFKVDKAPEKMADSMGAYVQELVTGKSRAQVQEETSVASTEDFAMEEDDFEDLDFDFDDGDSSARVSTPGNSSNDLDDFEGAEDPEYEARRAEEERRAEEQRRKDEAERAEEQARRDEQARRQEEQRLREEDERRREEERRAEEERLRKEEEKARADEQRTRQKEEDKRRKEEEKRRKEDDRQAAEQAERDRDDARRRQAEEDAVVDEYDYESDESDDFDDISFGSSVSVDEIEFGSSVSAEEPYEEEEVEEAPASRDRYDTLDDDDDDYDEDDYDEEEPVSRSSSRDDTYYDDDYYDELDSYEPDEREVAEARGSSRYDDDRSNSSRDDRSNSSTSGGSRTSTGGTRGGSTATISGTFVPHDPRVGITARAGYSRYQSWNFVSYGAEVSIPVSDTVYVQIGLAGYSVNRDVPEDLQAELGASKIWNTIVPFNLGVIYQGTKSNIRPYGGVDVTLTPYTRTFKVAVGARARIGVDIMIVETFGINLNTGLGVWYGSDFDLIEEGVEEFGFIPSFNAGTVLKF